MSSVVNLTTPFNNEDYITLNERLIGKLWIGKDLEGSGHGLILRYYPCIRLGGLGKTIKNLS
jgi:hypothetical protein